MSNANRRGDAPAAFASRHIGPRPAELKEMLATLGLASIEELTDRAVPSTIRLAGDMSLPQARSEEAALKDLASIARKNRVARSMIGMGYHDCHTPGVIRRNVFENPGWYTQYTPYQAEISQGRLEALLNFQTMICDLTGLEIANASLLDEGTAAAEAMQMCQRLCADPGRKRFWVADTCHPQTISVIQARASALGVTVVVASPDGPGPDSTCFGCLIQTPDTHGRLLDAGSFLAAARAAGVLSVVACDLLALTLSRSPGEMGADIALGSAQRFGVPLGFGGPHAAFLSARDAHKRQMPGRLVGVSKDSRGKPACRLALGTREQHIRREKATSNICTAQALLANMAAFYAIYHGPEGLKEIAERVHANTTDLAGRLRRQGHEVQAGPYFDTLRVRLNGLTAAEGLARAEASGYLLRSLNPAEIGISLDETTTLADLAAVEAALLPGSVGKATQGDDTWPDALRRTTRFLTHPVFHRFRSETEMLRYLRRLEARDLSLTTSMIPLGSCTMKLNASSEMFPVSWPEFSSIHPFAPESHTAGYRQMFAELEQWLAVITGFNSVSLQPNAGSQGEYAGLLVIRAYHHSRGDTARDVCLIPTSAHGTNPASAVMAGLRVIAVACDSQGNVDIADLRAKAAEHRDRLAALMVTYPSTHGVFEAGIREICSIVHEHGGQVYMDGANMNAQVGLCSPGDIGADVCHLNLHKTFCIPHGGGGPGMGPIGVAKHLAPFLPGHPVRAVGGSQAIGPISAAPWGSASILPISWVYIAAMGAAGLRLATQVAILNANYIAKRLENHFPVLYKGTGGFVAHECILDLRAFKHVTAEDVAKRLMDFGFHAPTLSWPVAGTLMVEPTESESREELDRFCEAMIRIHGEITAVENGSMDPRNNPLKNAPHTADQVASADWQRPYSREQAAFPAPWLHEHKYWPAASRIDNVYGDRNLVCTCGSVDAYAS